MPLSGQRKHNRMQRIKVSCKRSLPNVAVRRQTCPLALCAALQNHGICFPWFQENS
jgi:hypothetical protein